MDGISFSVMPGETFGLLGPNGAGKTTTLKILSGFPPRRRRRQLSTVTRSGDDSEVQRRLGVVPQGLALYRRHGCEEPGVLRSLARTRPQERQEQIAEILDLIGPRGGCRAAGRRIFRRYEAAAQHRDRACWGGPGAALGRAHGGDRSPVSEAHPRVGAALADDGMTVIYTSHYMEEVEYLCRRVAIMDHGRIIAQGPRTRCGSWPAKRCTSACPCGTDALGDPAEVLRPWASPLRRRRRASVRPSPGCGPGAGRLERPGRTRSPPRRPAPGGARTSRRSSWRSQGRACGIRKRGRGGEKDVTPAYRSLSAVALIASHTLRRTIKDGALFGRSSCRLRSSTSWE